MSGENRSLHYFFIILFAAAVVALGADELHRKYLRGEYETRSARGDGQELVETLHGNIDLREARAGYRDKTLRERFEGDQDLSEEERSPLGRFLHWALPGVRE